MILSLTSHEISGALVDNYVITYHLEFLMKHSIRIQEQIEYPVPYGVALGQDSNELETCARRYIRHNSQEVFETFSKYLTPLKVSCTRSLHASVTQSLIKSVIKFVATQSYNHSAVKSARRSVIQFDSQSVNLSDSQSYGWSVSQPIKPVR